MSNKWVKRWKVPRSNGDGYWTVAVDKDRVWGCSCPGWKFQRLPFAERVPCHHIVEVQRNGGNEAEKKERPRYTLACVRKPEYKEETNELLIPLIGIPDANMMEATICYYLIKYGYSWNEVKEIRGQIPHSWTKKAVIAHVERHGEACHPESFIEGRFR